MSRLRLNDAASIRGQEQEREYLQSFDALETPEVSRTLFLVVFLLLLLLLPFLWPLLHCSQMRRLHRGQVIQELLEFAQLPELVLNVVHVLPSKDLQVFYVISLGPAMAQQILSERLTTVALHSSRYLDADFLLRQLSARIHVLKDISVKIRADLAVRR